MGLRRYIAAQRGRRAPTGKPIGRLLGGYTAVSMARITVVNDNPDFLDLMRAILDDLGGVEPTVLDGDQCSVEDIAATEPQILILDLRMAEGTLKGWDLAVLARAHDTLRHVPLIVCSGDVQTIREREAEFLRIGNIHILEKPFDLADVEALLQSALATI